MYNRARAFRKKLEEKGPEALSDAELLSVLGVDVGAPALFELGRMDVLWLKKLGIEGTHAVLAAIELGRRVLRASDRRPRLRTTQQVYGYLEPALAARRRERMHVLCLSSAYVLLADVLVAEGTQEECPMEPGDIFRPAVIVGARAVVLAHNHPCGDVRPSEEDLVLTQQAMRVGEVLGIQVLDHLIVGAGHYFSMAEGGLCGLVAPATARDRSR